MWHKRYAVESNLFAGHCFIRFAYITSMVIVCTQEASLPVDCIEQRAYAISMALFYRFHFCSLCVLSTSKSIYLSMRSFQIRNSQLQKKETNFWTKAKTKREYWTHSVTFGDYCQIFHRCLCLISNMFLTLFNPKGYVNKSIIKKSKEKTLTWNAIQALDNTNRIESK